MNGRLKKFKRIIRECNYDNTYKMALAKSLVELSAANEYETDSIKISTKETAWKFLKYYWNQTIFFDLVQGSNLKKIPEVLQYTKELIEKYYETIGNRKPERFEKAETFLSENINKELIKTIDNISKTICKDVAWRFTRIDNESADELFVFDKAERCFIISKDMMDLLRENEEDLYDLINYRWGMILETFNSSPRINKKVKIIDQNEIRRNNLLKFRNLLDAENPTRKCFICGEEIKDNELSIDHVIPWSYMYSDDLWNLVYVHKGCNSTKRNTIPEKKEIDRLKERNIKLIEALKKGNYSGKQVNELEVAIDRDYVDKFWIGCKQ